MKPLLLLVGALLWAGCPDEAVAPADAAADAVADAATDADGGDTAAADGDAGAPPVAAVVVTFNTGTGPEPAHDSGPDDGYSQAMADLTDQWYGNGLNFRPLIEETRQFLAGVGPDVIVFQEIFWTGDCPNIPPEAQTGFVCEGWSMGDPTVAQLLLGDGYQVACHPGKPDKCAAVKTSFGTFAGCDGDFCLEGLTGFKVDTCGSGARVARGVIELTAGGTLTLVNYHGSSGVSEDDFFCRTEQVNQVFVDLGDGEPGANGSRNLVMGDLNTDPGRFFDADPSAARWLDFVGDGKPFRWHTDLGEGVEATYAGFVNIDHVISDTFTTGRCWHPSVTEGYPAFTETRYYDHLPAVCELSE